MGLDKARGQSDGNQKILFKILDTSGTPSIVKVSPPSAAGAISIVDTGPGIYDVTIKNFKGPQGAVNVQVSSEVISTMANCTVRTYTGDNLALTIDVNNDAGTDTDSSVDVCAEAF
jgi:hypothetical protein